MLQDRKLFPLGLMARTLGVSPRWLRAEADAGRLPAVKAEGSYLFDPQAVERVLLERAQQPCAEKAS